MQVQEDNDAEDVADGPVPASHECICVQEVLYLMSHVSAVGPDFPTSLEGVRSTVKEMFASDCMVTVDFSDVRGYNVPLTVLVCCEIAYINGLKRCNHLNSLMVKVISRAEPSSGMWAETTYPLPKFSLLVRRVNKNGLVYGNTIRIDNRHVVPTLLERETLALQVLQKMTKMWTSETRVVLQVHPERLEVQRLTAEYWGNNNKFCKPSDEFSVVSASYMINISMLSSYIHTFAWNQADHGFRLDAPGVLAKVSSFVDVRLMGTNLNVECAICMEPRRKFAHIRLGCPCGEAGSVKGAVLHLKCALTWLLNQERMWDHYYDHTQGPSPHGMDSPSCPFCKCRLRGKSPDMSRITASMINGHHVVDLDNDRLAYLEHMNFLLQARNSFPVALTHMMVPFSAGAIMEHIPTLSNELRDTVCITFPTAESLFRSAGGAQAPRAVADTHLVQGGNKTPDQTYALVDDALPSVAVSFPYQSDEVQTGVDRYNSMIYYIAVSCDLRYSTQRQNHRAEGNV